MLLHEDAVAWKRAADRRAGTATCGWSPSRSRRRSLAALQLDQLNLARGLARARAPRSAASSAAHGLRGIADRSRPRRACARPARRRCPMSTIVRPLGLPSRQRNHCSSRRVPTPEEHVGLRPAARSPRRTLRPSVGGRSETTPRPPRNGDHRRLQELRQLPHRQARRDGAAADHDHRVDAPPRSNSAAAFDRGRRPAGSPARAAPTARLRRPSSPASKHIPRHLERHRARPPARASAGTPRPPAPAPRSGAIDPRGPLASACAASPAGPAARADAPCPAPMNADGICAGQADRPPCSPP